ncbi:LuxR C-terminal-related transcriptional regulator [Lysinibacillus capsici]|uniref:LuxR C-terminal-related transcriptional regulator n=1 Tax=Lysinibacillus capsici TaxID=2115968 RepID=UPI00029C9791|nr:LuxR C-terminal-related transcriptional regulator [Lysinibacillus capsici]EKU44935.1 YqaQ [Lysinibacillus fusiformis ZB2]MBU5253095.1 LuxR C-terminal-related transcriptional regulator [Lysinibacillus capsici]
MGKQGQIKVTKENLIQWIENYRWMVETVEEARQPVAKMDNNSYIGAKTAMYGIEATLPKASGGTSDPVFTEVQRRVYSLNYRIKEYEQKIAEVQKRMPYVIGDREVEVLHRLLDGDSMRAIGKHMGLSSTTIFRVRNNILSQMLK